jgi:hypothetical protein
MTEKEGREAWLSFLDCAIELAVIAYHGQRDKAGMPYVLHSLHVMMQVDTVKAKIVGVLHDVKEDRPHIWENRKDCFPAEIRDAVDAISRGPDESWDGYIGRVGANALAAVVKMADLDHNMDLSRIPDFGDEDAARALKYMKAKERLSRALPGLAGDGCEGGPERRAHFPAR